MDAFFEKYKELAMASQRVTGVPTSVTLAQAALESAYGKSALTVQDNNFFGTKAGAKWIGKKSLWKTTEYIPISKKAYYQNYFTTEGREIISVAPYDATKEKWTVKDYFRKYDDAEQAFTDHAQIYAVKKAATITNGSMDYKVWCNALKQAGYATDVNYPSKLISIIEKNNLAALDTEAAKKKLTNSTWFLLVTTALTFGAVYYFRKDWLKKYTNYFYIFALSVVIGVLAYLTYLKIIDLYYNLQN